MSSVALRSLPVAGHPTPATRPTYRVPQNAMDHAAMSSLEARIRRLLLSLWDACALTEKESQLLRDQARGDGRSLGLVRLERGLRAMAKDCPEAGYAIATEIIKWTDETFARPTGVQHWRQEGGR